MTIRRPVAVLVAALAGCSAPPPPADPVPATAHVHPHDGGKMLRADAGKYHGALTAHLSSKDGNELDVFVETADSDPKPVALAVESFTAAVIRAGDPKGYELRFEPAPAGERPKGEAAGTCSHFVAKAGWMRPDDELKVAIELPIGGKTRTVSWEGFIPRKYAHHID